MAKVPGRLTCSAKLARVVLENCGPLSPSEVAAEAYLSPDRARAGLVELNEEGLADPVCGVCADKEEVYALTDSGRAMEPNP